MTIRSASNAIRDTVAAWLDDIEIQPIDDDAETYTIATRARPPKPGDVMTYPSVALLPSLSYRNRNPAPISGTEEEQEDGSSTYLELTGQLDGTIDLVIFCSDETQEDEVSGAIEAALIPTDDADAPGAGNVATRRIVLTAEDYHDQPVTLARKSFRSAPFRESQNQDVWRPVITCDVAIPVVRERVTTYILPIVGLTVDDDGEYEIDIDEGTTTPPA